MSKRADLVRRMHAKGMTYEEIGEIFVFSKQRAQQLAHSHPGDGFHANTIAKIKYVGLRNWMLENRVKVCDLEKQCGSRLHRALSSEGNPTKKLIDKILAITGLTYEECFKEEVLENAQETSPVTEVTENENHYI